MFADGARALDRRRRHLDRLRRRRRPSPTRGSKGCSSTSSRSTRRASSTSTLYRVIKDNIRFPESSLGDMKSQMAACRLGGAAARRAVRQIRPRHACWRRSTRSSTRPSRSAATWSSQLPDGVYEASASIDDDGVLKGEEVPIHVKVTVKSRRHDHRPLRLLGRAQGRDQLAHLCRRARRLQGADRPARSGQRRLVPRAQGHHPRRQHHDGALPRADGGLERHRADRGRHHRHGAGQGDAGPRAGRAPRRCSAARWCSSARIPRPSAASWCRASRAAAGAAGRSRTASPARSRSARATCATARSRASS